MPKKKEGKMGREGKNNGNNIAVDLSIKKKEHHFLSSNPQLFRGWEKLGVAKGG